jgi:hypothetical protein
MNGFYVCRKLFDYFFLLIIYAFRIVSYQVVQTGAKNIEIAIMGSDSIVQVGLHYSQGDTAWNKRTVFKSDVR